MCLLLSTRKENYKGHEATFLIHASILCLWLYPTVNVTRYLGLFFKSWRNREMKLKLSHMRSVKSKNEIVLRETNLFRVPPQSAQVQVWFRCNNTRWQSLSALRIWRNPYLRMWITLFLKHANKSCHSSQNKYIKHAFELSMACVWAAVSESICERATERRRVFGRLACTIQNGNRWRKI